MALNNGIPINWDSIEDDGLFGKSRTGLEALLNNTALPDAGNNADTSSNRFVPATLNNNPLNNYEWQTYWSRELGDAFFGGFDNKASDNDDEVETYDETNIYKSLKPDRRAFLYTDKNRNKKFDKGGDVYRFEIKIFISKDGAKLLRAWKGALVQDNELLIFLENNSGDVSSGAILLAKAGKNVTGKIEEYADNKELKNWVNQVYNIKGSELKKLLVSAGDKLWFVNVLRKIVKVAANLYAWPIDKVSEFFYWIGKKIEENLRISESTWKTESDTAKLMYEHQKKLAELFKDFFKDWQDSKYQPGKDEQKRMKGYEKIVQEAFKEIYEIQKLYPDIAPQMLWAMICGILNGIVDLIAGIFTFIGLLFKLLAEGVRSLGEVAANPDYYFYLILEYSDNFTQAIKQIKWKEVFEQATAAYYRFIYIEAPQLLLAAVGSLIQIDPREISYFSGYIGINILICFVPLVDLVEITNVTKLAKPIQELFETILTLVKKTGKFTAQKAGDLFTLFEDFIELLRKGTKEVGNFIKKVFEAIKKWLEELLGITKSEYDFDALGFNNKKISGKRYLEGETLTRQEIKAWEELAEKFKARLVRKLKPKQLKLLIINDARAGFNPFTGEIFVQKGFTKYEIFHEMKHAEECALIGQEAYVEGMIGSKIEKIIRTYKREKYVYDEIIKNENLFNKAEIEHAKWYINEIITLLKKEGIDPSKIIQSY